MARVQPFVAITYARQGTDISPLVAPPYDVIGAELRERLLARDPHNVVALELAEGPLDPALPGNRYNTAGTRWEEWLRSGVLVREPEPALYVVEQRFELSGKQRRRRALVVAVGLEPFDAGVILPHERTLPKALDDRLNLIHTTRANLSPVLALYSDPTGEVGSLVDDSATGEPLLTATDDDGVACSVWAVSDPDIHAAVAERLAVERIFIADGHHRYSVALAYRDEQREQHPERADSDQSYDFVMMALMAMEDPELLVLPTHRVADGLPGFDTEAFLEALGEHFTVEPADFGDLDVLLDGSAQTSHYLIKVRDSDQVWLAALRPDIDLDAAIAAQRSPAWKRLDVAVLQELVLEPLLGIHPDRPDTLERLSFVKDPDEALALVGTRDVAFLMRPTLLDQLREVSLAGETMPQKSTYFHPKLLSGLLFNPLD